MSALSAMWTGVPARAQVGRKETAALHHASKINAPPGALPETRDRGLQPSASQVPTPAIRVPAMRLSQRALPRRCSCSLSTRPPWA